MFLQNGTSGSCTVLDMCDGSWQKNWGKCLKEGGWECCQIIVFSYPLGCRLAILSTSGSVKKHNYYVPLVGLPTPYNN